MALGGGTRARTGTRLLVYGGPYLESDVVRGFVAAERKSTTELS